MQRLSAKPTPWRVEQICVRWGRSPFERVRHGDQIDTIMGSWEPSGYMRKRNDTSGNSSTNIPPGQGKHPHGTGRYLGPEGPSLRGRGQVIEKFEQPPLERVEPSLA